jgi:hypothetical protein
MQSFQFPACSGVIEFLAIQGSNVKIFPQMLTVTAGAVCIFVCMKAGLGIDPHGHLFVTAQTLGIQNAFVVSMTDTTIFDS